ncbi:MAG: hypothetical protein AB7F59_10060 [Bdellovibrionales bacterium]
MTAQLTSPLLLKMVETLLKENPLALEKSFVEGPWRLARLEFEEGHPHYPIVVAYIESGREFSSSTPIRLRTNGQAVFFDESYDFTQRSKDRRPIKMVYVDGQNEIHIMDQTHLILMSLPETVVLSRVMTQEELELWSQGKLNEIESHGLGGLGRTMSISRRTAFALNYFEFGNYGYKPVLFKIPRAELEKLYHLGLLSIDTYNSINDPYQGLSREALTSFGLEVELVVFDRGQELIQSFMAHPIQVPDEFPVKLRYKYEIDSPVGLTKEQQNLWMRQKMRELLERERKSKYK